MILNILDAPIRLQFRHSFDNHDKFHIKSIAQNETTHPGPF